jgi:hypothetical protein
MSEVFDDIIDRETDVARVAAVVASDFRFAYFGTAAFAVSAVAARSEIDGRHPDESPAHGEPAQCDARAAARIPRPSKPDDETVTLYADGRAVEIPVV